MRHIQDVEQTFNDATQMYEAKEISKEEYLNILQGLEVEKSLTLGTDQMTKKQELQTAVQAAITAVSLVA
jgi:hypothetical protein